MAAVHTDASAIFGSTLVNKAEEKIQYIKYRPVQPYNSKTPITFSIPGISSQYVSLRVSYLFVECHMEETTDVQCNLMGDEPPRKRCCQDSIQSSAPKKFKRKANGQRDEDSDDDDEYDVKCTCSNT